MATAYKILGQSAPSATTETDLYTVPASTQTIVSTITVSNRSTSAATYRISISPDGAATASSQYLIYDANIVGNGFAAFTLGLTIDSTDKIRVYASTANLTFQAFGTEVA